MNAVVPFATSTEKMLAEQFRAMAASHRPDARRDEAFATFAAAGLPHRRIEAWHYTDLRALMREAFPPAPAPDVPLLAKARNAIAALPTAPGGRVVLLNGTYVVELSDLSPLASGVRIGSSLADGAEIGTDLAAAEKLGRAESVVSLNAALFQGGAAIDVTAKTVMDAPLEILSITSGGSPAAAYARHTLRVGNGATASIVERHVALEAGRSQSHMVIIASLDESARCDHVAIVTELGVDTQHVGSMLVRLGPECHFTSSTLIATGGLTRRQVYLEFAGPNAKAHFRGASLLDGRCHADTTLVITHAAPHCESRELYKHVLDGESTGVYQGKVIVAPGAQKTDGKMLSKAVFLDEGSAMYNKPELEIFADDVVCGHGATAGSLDDDQLFYLRARGIPLKEAQALLLEAFADEAIVDIADEALRVELTERVSRWLRQRGT